MEKSDIHIIPYYDFTMINYFGTSNRGDADLYRLALCDNWMLKQVVCDLPCEGTCSMSPPPLMIHARLSCHGAITGYKTQKAFYNIVLKLHASASCWLQFIIKCARLPVTSRPYAKTPLNRSQPKSTVREHEH